LTYRNIDLKSINKTLLLFFKTNNIATFFKFMSNKKIDNEI